MKEKNNLRKLKNDLIKTLLDIPINYKGERELYKLAKHLNVKPSCIIPILDELCDKNLLERQIQYYCPICKDTYILNSKDNPDEEYTCINCDNIFIPTKYITGYEFYNVLNKIALQEELVK